MSDLRRNGPNAEITDRPAAPTDGRPPDRKRPAEALPIIDSLDELHRAVREEPELCLRYSRGPRADLRGPSVDHESGLILPGLSVTPLRPEPWWTKDVRDWLARQLSHYVHLKDGAGDERRAWLLIGRTAGYGPDREPLLWPWTPVAWVSESCVDEGRSRYDERFDIGRDSTD